MRSFRSIPKTLPFTKADLRLPAARRKGRRNSISGVQTKVLLALEKGTFNLVESGGDFILKPVPEDARSRFAADIPANEHLTMQIASKLFGIQVAENTCVSFADGELAYLTRRFDRRDGLALRQEDLCQLAGRSEETHGESYKYDYSYEEMADVIRAACPAYAVELPKVFRQIVFDYLFCNGDAHLKNFSMYESELGDFVMTPAYDLLNTDLHYANDLTFMALSLFKDENTTTEAFETLGYYTEPDFVLLGRAYGLDERAVTSFLVQFRRKEPQVAEMVANSLLSSEAKTEYLRLFHERLAMFRNLERDMKS